jgi:hypothetical protein
MFESTVYLMSLHNITYSFNIEIDKLQFAANFSTLSATIKTTIMLIIRALQILMLIVVKTMKLVNFVGEQTG